MMSDQFWIYLLFSALWPCVIAVIYTGLERLFPKLLIVDHESK